MTRRAFRLPLTRGRLGAELDAELRFHLDERVDELSALVASAAASIVPARRAAAVDPARTLQAQ